MITDEKLTYVNLKNTEVYPEKNYEIRLSGTKGIDFFEEVEQIMPHFTKEVDQNIGNTTINGEKIEQNLYFEIR